MSDVPQMGPGFPFPPGFDLNELFRMLQSPGPVNIEIARKMAASVATMNLETGTQETEASVDASSVASFEQLVRAAQLAVADTTGITETLSVGARCVDRKTWAELTLDGLAPVFESLATALNAANQAPEPTDDPNQGAEAFLGMMMQAIVPVILGTWAGSMIGQLAHHALGQYDLPLPMRGTPAQLFVVTNIDEFAQQWSLPLDELRYAVVLREVVHGAQRTVPWVRERLSALASSYVGAYEPRPDAFEGMLSGLDLNDPASMESLGEAADARRLLDAMRSERQEPILEELQRFVSVIEGYTDVAVETLGERMVTSHSRIDEALRRHRVERGDAAAFVDRLLGLALDRKHYDEGVAFCRGVLERSGFEQLNRLWTSEATMPTRAEFEAPGLWLARIDLPQ